MKRRIRGAVAASALIVASGCGASTPNSECPGAFDSQTRLCFARSPDEGRPCRRSSECHYYCECPPEDDDPVGECSRFPPLEQYCAITEDGFRELVVY